jgi:hypothetical protein
MFGYIILLPVVLSVVSLAATVVMLGFSQPLLFWVVFAVMLALFHFSLITQRRSPRFWSLSQYAILGVAALGFFALAQEAGEVVEALDRRALEAIVSTTRSLEIERNRERASFHRMLYSTTGRPEQLAAAQWFDAVVDALSREVDLRMWQYLDLGTVNLESPDLIVQNKSKSIVGLLLLDATLDQLRESRPRWDFFRDFELRLVLLLLVPVVLAFEVTRVTAERRGHC